MVKIQGNICAIEGKDSELVEPVTLTFSYV